MSRRAVLGGALGIAAATAVPSPAWAHGDDSLIALRRDLHAHPEGPGEERRTAGIVARRLRAAGLAVTTGVGGHGVVGVLRGGRPGRTVAYRADMDAVPPEDQVPGGTGPEHFCGHDLHVAIGVGVAERLARRRDRLAGRVAFVFQPAEEILTGAAAMIDDGLFDLVQPAEFHALHCFPYDVGEFVVTGGFGLPGQDRGLITLAGDDAAARARTLSTAIDALGTITRPQTTEDSARVVRDVLRPDTPLARFVFMTARALDARVEVSFRCWPEERFREVRRDVHRLAAAAGATAVEFPERPFPAVITPERQGRALERHLGTAARRAYAAYPFAGDDFALFAERVPSTYSYLGVRAPDKPVESSFPHFSSFDPDERAIGLGVRAMASWLSARTRA